MNLAEAREVLKEITGTEGNLTEQISTLATNVSDSYDEVKELGGTLPSKKNIDNLPETIEGIE